MTTRGPYSKGIQRRREILDRAIEVFAEKGFESTSLRAIGEAIGVSHAALKHYFDSREALLVEVLRERDLKMTATLAAQGIEDAFTENIAVSEYNKTIPGLIGLYTVMMATAVEPGHEVAADFFRERFAAGRAGTREALERALADRGLESDVDLDDLASLLMAASDGLQVQWLLDDRAVDIARVMRLLERILPKGLNASGTPPE